MSLPANLCNYIEWDSKKKHYVACGALKDHLGPHEFKNSAYAEFDHVAHEDVSA